MKVPWSLNRATIMSAHWRVLRALICVALFSGLSLMVICRLSRRRRPVSVVSGVPLGDTAMTTVMSVRLLACVTSVWMIGMTLVIDGMRVTMIAMSDAVAIAMTGAMTSAT